MRRRFLGGAALIAVGILGTYAWHGARTSLAPHLASRKEHEGRSGSGARQSPVVERSRSQDIEGPDSRQSVDPGTESDDMQMALLQSFEDSGLGVQVRCAVPDGHADGAVRVLPLEGSSRVFEIGFVQGGVLSFVPSSPNGEALVRRSTSEPDSWLSVSWNTVEDSERTSKVECSGPGTPIETTAVWGQVPNYVATDAQATIVGCDVKVDLPHDGSFLVYVPTGKPCTMHMEVRANEGSFAGQPAEVDPRAGVDVSIGVPLVTPSDEGSRIEVEDLRARIQQTDLEQLRLQEETSWRLVELLDGTP